MNILQIDTMSGCGTHLLTNLIRTAGYHRLDPDCLKLLQVFVEWTYNPEARSTVVGYAGQKSKTVVVELYNELVVATSNKAPDRDAVLSVFVERLPQEKIVIVNYDNLTCPRDTVLDDNSVLSWSSEEVSQLRDLLAEAIDKSGREYFVSNFVRHPVDVFLSKEERGGGDDKFKHRILEFFRIISAKNVPSVKYEELCETEDSAPLLKKLGFTEQDIEKLDLSVIHRGEVYKYKRYPKKKIDVLSMALEPALSAFGYDCKSSGIGERLIATWHKVEAEIDVVNRMAEGDYRASGAYNWHKRSVPGRIWLRLVLLNRRKRENIAGWHISIGQVPPFRT